MAFSQPVRSPPQTTPSTGKSHKVNLYNNNKKLYKWDTGAFPVPMDTLRFSVIYTFKHIHTVPVCSSSADIIYARVLGSFPPATDSMPAPLILSPTCIMLIHIPTRYPFCVAAKSGKHWIWKPPITYTNPLFVSIWKKRLTARINQFWFIPHTYYIHSPNPWQGIVTDPDKD